MDENLGRLEATLGFDVSQLTTALDAFKGTIDKMNSSLESLQRTADTLAGAFDKIGTSIQGAMVAPMQNAQNATVQLSTEATNAIHGLSTSFNSASAEINNWSSTMTASMSQLQQSVSSLAATQNQTSQQTQKQLQTQQQQIQQLTARINTLQQSLQRTSSATKGISTSFKRIGAAAVGAFSVHKIAKFTQECVTLAAKAEGIRTNFEKLNTVSLQSLRDATRGTISDLDLMSSAVQAKNFQLPMEDLATYFQFAASRAIETGESVDYLVDSIVRGIGRKSVLIMDNLGISAARIRDEAKTSGDFMKAAGKIIKEELGAAGDVASTTMTKIQQLTASYENFKSALGDLVIEAGLVKVLNVLANAFDYTTYHMKGGANAIDEYKDSMKGIDLNELVYRQEELTKSLKGYEVQLQKVKEAGTEALKDAYKTGEHKFYTKQQKELEGIIKTDKERLAVLGQIITRRGKEEYSVEQVKDKLKKIRDELQVYYDIARSEGVIMSRQNQERIKQLEQEESFWKKIESGIKDAAQPQTLKKLKDDLTNIERELLGAALGSEAFKEGAKEAYNLKKQIEEIEKALKFRELDVVKDLGNQFKVIDTMAKTMGAEFDATEQKIAALEKAFEELAEISKGKVTPAMQKILDQLNELKSVHPSEQLAKELALIAQRASVMGEMYDVAAAKVDLYAQQLEDAITSGRASAKEIQDIFNNLQQAKIDEIYEKYNKSIKEASQQNLVFGNSFDFVEEKIKATKDIITDLLSSGIDPFSNQIQSLQLDLESLSISGLETDLAKGLEAINAQAERSSERFNMAKKEAELYYNQLVKMEHAGLVNTEAFDLLKQKWEEASASAASYELQQKNMKQMANAMVGALQNVGEALGTAFGKGEDAGKAMAQAVISSVQQIISVLLMQMVAGQVASASKWGIAGLAIASAGIGAMMALFSSSTAGLATGGIIPQGFNNDTFPAMLSSNEAVIPLNRLNSIMGFEDRQMAGDVQFRISGTDLIGVISNTQTKKRLIR